MKTICQENMCIGCFACAEACPKSAISIKDTIKTINAVIDEKKCIHCGICEKVCQQINPLELKAPTFWYQGWAEDPHSRSLSSSGGFAYHIMKQFIKEGGVVCSCSFSDGEFIYIFADNEDDLSKFRGSKYVKSNPKNIYSKIKLLLQTDNKVLFLGLPCHVAAVIEYVGSKYSENLYTVDLICHGSPSAKLLNKYLDEKGIQIKKISGISFRQKNKFRVYAEDEVSNENIELTPPGVRDRYTIGFLSGLFYTENCYQCRYAGLNRVSDITLGDSWGSELEATDEGAKGISLAICQSEKGVSLLKRCDLKLLPVDIDKAIEANHQLREPSHLSEEREKFFELLNSGNTVNKAIFKCYSKTCFRQDIKALLIKLHVLKSHRG